MNKSLGMLPVLFLSGAVVGCAGQPAETGSSTYTGSITRYQCYTYVGSKHVLTLPVAPLNSDVGMVTVTFHGDGLDAIYQRSGLTQLWIFEDGLYIKLDPDLSAAYMDFRGAEEGEMRKPEAVFECKKRR